MDGAYESVVNSIFFALYAQFGIVHERKLHVSCKSLNFTFFLRVFEIT